MPSVGLLCLLVLAKVVAAYLTIGSGGSAGDFAPPLAIGALLRGASGARAAGLRRSGDRPRQATAWAEEAADSSGWLLRAGTVRGINRPPADEGRGDEVE